MFLNRMPRFEVLSDEALATIGQGWERLAQEVGVRFDHPRALELFADAGQTVDGEVVRFDPGFLRRHAATAPAEFTLHARNPERDLTIGGDAMVFGAVNGPPFVRLDGERRDGTMADLENLLRLAHMADVIDTPGRNMLEPGDVPLDIRHLRPQEAGVEVDDLAVHRLAGLLKQLQRARGVEPHAHLGHQALPAGVERGQVVIAQHIQARHRVQEHETDLGAAGCITQESRSCSYLRDPRRRFRRRPARAPTRS